MLDDRLKVIRKKQVDKYDIVGYYEISQRQL